MEVPRAVSLGHAGKVVSGEDDQGSGGQRTLLRRIAGGEGLSSRKLSNSKCCSNEAVAHSEGF